MNASIAANHLGKFTATIDNCTQVIDIDAKTVKAFFLRAKAHFKLKHYDEALNDIKAAIGLNPNDKALRDEYEIIRKTRTDFNAA